MIASDIFEDDFICGQGWFERLLWIGLVVACADDQGRFLNSPAIIRARVFPTDTNVTDEKVELALTNFAEAGKVILYSAGVRRLVQIARWWIYQTPAWASPSKYPAPEEWTDRVKYHTTGRKIVIENWDHRGGYSLHSPLHRAIEEEEVKVKGEVEEEEEEKKPAPAAPAAKRKTSPAETAAAAAQFGGAASPLTIQLYRRVTGQISIPPGENGNEQADWYLGQILTVYGGDIERAAPDGVSVFNRWCATQGKSGKRYSVTNTGWLEWWLNECAPSAPVSETDALEAQARANLKKLRGG
jgi:hypothetical protein